MFDKHFPHSPIGKNALGFLCFARRDPVLAQQTLQDCLRDFRERGIYEWVNGGVRVLPDYFVSAASVYSLLRESRF